MDVPFSFKALYLENTMKRRLLSFPEITASIIVIALMVSGCKVSKNKTEIPAGTSYTLSVQLSQGVSGTPDIGSYSYNEGKVVSYQYRVQSGYANLTVKLDGQPVPAGGTITMNSNHSLNVSAEVAADYFVSVGGSDGNDGKSVDRPFRTITRAMQAVQPGKSLLIMAGTYHEKVLLQNLGHPSAPITVKGETGTVLDGLGSMTIGIWCEQCTNLVFEKLEIRNYTDIGIGALMSSAITFRSLEVHHNGFAVQFRDWEFEGYGIEADECSGVLIENNDVYQNGPNPQLPDLLMGTGINTFGCSDSIIRNNQCHENIGGGILVEDGLNVLVEGNNVYDNDLDATAEEWWDGGLWVDGGHDITIRNNTFTGNLGPGIQISDEDIQEPYGYILENNTSTGNYYGIYIWNFGSEDWPPERILQRSGNLFENNSVLDIWIEAWGCPPEDQPCD
jgi:parallel beta-helix repeat protein